MKNQVRKKYTQQGFTLAELALAVALLGILSSIAIPSFFSQLLITRQRGCSAQLAMVQTSTMLFNDENAIPPASWSDLNEMSAILIDSGTAGSIKRFGTIKLRNDNYSMTITNPYDGSSSIYGYECTSDDANASGYNVLGCVNIDNGATEIKLGKKDNPVTSVNCKEVKEDD